MGRKWVECGLGGTGWAENGWGSGRVCTETRVTVLVTLKEREIECVWSLGSWGDRLG